MTPLVSSAVARHHEIKIRILQTAPRTEDEILKAIQKKKTQMNEIINVNEAAPLYDELNALEWLLPKVRLQNSEHFTENSFV